MRSQSIVRKGLNSVRGLLLGCRGHQLGIMLGQSVVALGDRKAEEQKSIADKLKLIGNITELN